MAKKGFQILFVSGLVLCITGFVFLLTRTTPFFYQEDINRPHRYDGIVFIIIGLGMLIKGALLKQKVNKKKDRQV